MDQIDGISWESLLENPRIVNAGEVIDQLVKTLVAAMEGLSVIVTQGSPEEVIAASALLFEFAFNLLVTIPGGEEEDE